MMTDYLAHKAGQEAIIVRYNGGAQAGHTVVTPEGARHVFSHFGSGSLIGCSTHLSKHFICNPMTFNKEHKSLPSPKVTIDPRSLITTPWDMIHNQLIEHNRGNDKHGSCGLGINDTIQREKDISLTYNDLFIMDKFERGLYIDNIHDYYIKKINNDFHSVNDIYANLITNTNIRNAFNDYILYFMEHTDILDDADLKSHNHLIFEGAQGLMLDQDHSNFPHVTHSKTGLHNVMSIIAEADITCVPEVYYMSRAYLTRHGAGPMSNEQSKPYEGIVDITNVPNQWQDSLRYGLLDIEVLINEISNDCSDYYVCNNVVITCLDQLPDKFNVMYGGAKVEVTKEQLKELLFSYDMFRNTLTSSNPTRDKIN